MSLVRRSQLRLSDRERERGQGLVEFTLIVPLFLMFLLIALEFGLAFNHKLTIGLASREGARVASALANGGAINCASGNDPLSIDAQTVAAVQSILKSPGSDVVMANVSQIRIYKATSTGDQSGSSVDVWSYAPGAGPNMGTSGSPDYLDFSQTSVGWPVCSRNNASNPDSVGVQVVYTYHLQTALGGIVKFMFPSNQQSATIAMTDQTVMSLNPTK